MLRLMLGLSPSPGEAALDAGEATAPADASIVDVRSPRVRALLDVCSRRAGASGVFGEIEVNVVDPRHPRVSGVTDLSSNRETVERCIRDAITLVSQQLERERNDRGSPQRWPRSFRLTLGDASAPLPPLEVLLPRWESTLSGARTDAGRTENLAGILPRGVSLRKDGCLTFSWRGPALVAGLDLWARQSGRALHEVWFSLPFFQQVPRRPSGVLVLSSTRLLIGHSSLQSDEVLCLRDLDQRAVQEILSQVRKIGTCWQGGLEEILRSARTVFPTGHVYESVSTNGATTCALNRKGEMTCCGASLRKPPPTEARWKAVSVRWASLCGVSKRGRLACFGIDEPPPILEHLQTLSQGIGPLCAIDERGRPICFERVSRPRRGTDATPPSRLDWGLEFNCRLRKPEGGEVCDSWQEVLLAKRPWPTVRRTSASAHGICAISKSHTLLCSLGKPPIDETSDIRDVATSPLTGTACALKADGALTCWSQRDATRLPFSQDAPFATLSSVMDDDVVCAIGADGTAHYAQRVADTGTTSWAPERPPSDRFRIVTAGGGQCCGITTSGAVKCWGVTQPGPNRGAAPTADTR